MQLVIERGELLKSLGHVTSVVERRTTIPILSNVLLQARTGSLRFNATDLELVSGGVKITSGGRHITGWTAVDGYFGSFTLTLDQLFVCSDGKSQRVGYPGAVADKLAAGATLGMCEQDLPLQFK